MLRRSMVFASLTALFALGCAQAGPTGTPLERSATSAEAQALAPAVTRADRARFTRVDRDQDGFLSAGEVDPAVLQALDADGNGKLSFSEAMAQTPSAAERAKLAAEVQQAFAASNEAPRQSLAEGLAQPGAAAKAGKGTPVIFVPGFLDFEFYFAVVKKKLEAQGRPTAYLDVFPNVSDITVAAGKLSQLIEETRQRTGAKRVDVVAHSMGGLITRYYLKNMGGTARVDHLVTLATPHHGTIVAHIPPTSGGEQMRPGSAFLTALNADDETPGPVHYTSIRGGWDEIVIPHDSPILEGAENFLSPKAMHGTIFVDPLAWKHLDAGLKR